MQIVDSFFLVVIIMFSAIIHEVMHGVMADRLGDPTARYAGRLTLNPIPHLDPIGSIILPLTLALTHAPIFFGWAKPVPYNPYNLRPGRFSEALVAFAGPLSNLVIALIGGLVLRSGSFPSANDVVFLIVVVNSMLFIFNLIPVPPLDGSKVLQALLPSPLQGAYREWRNRLEMNPFLGTGLVLLIIILLGNSFGAFVYSFAYAIAGI